MKKSSPAIILGLSLLIAGIGIMLAAIIAVDFDFDNFVTDSYETVTHTVNSDFENIVIATQIHNINLAPSEDGVCKVVGSASDNIKIEVECDGYYLNIKTVDDRKWYNFIGINIGSAELTLYLPESEYTSLTVASDTGHIVIPESFGFTGASMATSTGAISFRASIEQELALASDTGSISVSKQKLSMITVETSTGGITLENIEAENHVSVKASTGRIELHEIKCNSLNAETSTGSITLKNVIAENEVKIKASTGRVTLTSSLSDSLSVETSTGDVKLYASDAESIDINTDTGDVEGSILTSKIFTTETDTGKVKVPQTTESGTCKIRTNTGNITITIE